MSEHAFLPPSGAPAWVVCAMWPTMNKMYPETETSTESLEGSTAHWIIKQQTQAFPETTAEIKVGDICVETGMPVDDEMLEGAEVYADALAPVMMQRLHVEERIAGKRIHDTLNWGTPDTWTLDEQGLRLDVFDYKHGHEYVEVYENWQLINYTALIFEKLGVNGSNDNLINVHLHVVQPRSYTPAGAHRVWEVRGDDLRGYFNILAGAATRATSDKPVATVGPQCKHCPGRHACTALQRAALGAADQALHALPVELSPSAVGIELRMLKRAAALLDARITGLEEQGTAMIRRGDQVPWFRMGTTQGRENWGKPVEEVIALGSLLGVNLSKPGAITPNQARKLGVAAAIVEAYVAPRGTAMKIMEDDGVQARKVFG